MFNGRRQPSCGGTSRMMREYQVRICERLGMKFPGPTRPQQPKPNATACPQLVGADISPKSAASRFDPNRKSNAATAADSVSGLRSRPQHHKQSRAAQ